MRLKQLDLGWAAGILEGEGTIYCQCYLVKRWQCRSLALAVQMTDKEPITRFAALFGGHVLGPYRSTQLRHSGKEKKLVYQTRFTGPRAVKIFELLRPHLSPRRQRQGDSAIRKWRARPNPRVF